jgi:hypothetical protein
MYASAATPAAIEELKRLRSPPRLGSSARSSPKRSRVSSRIAGTLLAFTAIRKVVRWGGGLAHGLSSLLPGSPGQVPQIVVRNYLGCRPVNHIQVPRTDGIQQAQDNLSGFLLGYHLYTPSAGMGHGSIEWNAFVRLLPCWLLSHAVRQRSPKVFCLASHLWIERLIAPDGCVDLLG